MGWEDSISDMLYGCLVTLLILQAEWLTLLTSLEEMTSHHKHHPRSHKMLCATACLDKFFRAKTNPGIFTILVGFSAAHYRLISQSSVFVTLSA